ncbi:MAG: DUF6089 family protein [Putridiphycobacter sp.]
MKEKLLFICFAFILGVNSLNAQAWRRSRHEVQLGLGASNFLGDLGGAKGVGTHGIKDFKFQSTRPTIMMGYKYMITPAVSVKGSFITSYLSGDDALTKNPVRQNRNLSFRSGLWELAASVELYPFTEKVRKDYKVSGTWGHGGLTLSPYFVTGVGFAMFQPKAKYQGSWVKLQPLGTEGQGLAGRPDKYKRYTISFPIGMGLKYVIDKNWSLGFEMSLRYTLTDYIDDVSTSYYIPSAIEAANGPVAAALADRTLDPSLGYTGVNPLAGGGYNYLQRGDPYYNDAYTFAIFSVHYRFIKGSKFIPRF